MTRNSAGTRSNLAVRARKRAYNDDSASACSEAAVVELDMGKDTPEMARQRGEMAVRGLRDLQPVVF
jgi:hypothetical protein